MSKKEATLISEIKDRSSIEYWKEVAKHWFSERNMEKKKRLIAEQKQLTTEGMFEEYTNAYNAMVRKRNDEAKKLAVQEVLSDYAAHNDIQDVVKDHRSPFNFKITGVVAALIIGLVVIWQLSTNPEFRATFNQNIGYIVVSIVGGIVLVAVFFKGKLGR